MPGCRWVLQGFPSSGQRSSVLTLRASLPRVRIPPRRVPTMPMPRDFRCIVLPMLAGLLACMSASAATKGLEREVNTFIGTQDEGNTFPGASAPFGMIQVSPITDHYAGYRYDDSKIRGFGHSFVSGAGCWEQGGQIAVLPVTGTIGPGGRFDTSDAKAR